MSKYYFIGKIPVKRDLNFTRRKRELKYLQYIK